MEKKLYAATIQVLLEAEGNGEACDYLSETLRPLFLDWQYLAPTFPGPQEIAKEEARRHFDEYGDLAEEDEEPEKDPDFLYLVRKSGLVDLYPATPAAWRHSAETHWLFPCSPDGWVKDLTSLDTPGSITGRYLEGMTFKDITGIDFLYAEDDKGSGYYYPLSKRLKKRIGPGKYSTPAWHGPLGNLQQDWATVYSWATKLGLTYIKVDMPK